MEKNNSARNFSYVGIGRLVGLFLQAIFYLLFANLLEPESYGKLNVILAFAGTFSIISRFGLGYTLQVYQSKNQSESSEQVKTLFLITTSSASLILLTIDIFAAVLCFGMSLFIMYQQNLLGLKKYKKFMITTVVSRSLFFVIPILLYFVYDISGVVLGMAIASFVPSFLFFRDFKPKSFVTLKYKIKVLIQNFLVESSSLSIMVDKLLISYLYGLFIVGVYQFNLQVLMALQVLPGVLLSYLVSEESSGATHRKISNLVILAAVGVAILVIIISPFFVQKFFPNYSTGIFALQIMVLAIIPQSIGSVFGAKLIAKESPQIGFISIVYVAIILLLIALLGQILELVGLSLAVLISSILHTTFLFILYKKTKLSN